MPGHGDCDHGVCRDGEAVGSDSGGDDCDFDVGANDWMVMVVLLTMVEVIEENATVVVMVVEMVMVQLLREVMLVEVMVMGVMVVEVSVGRG